MGREKLKIHVLLPLISLGVMLLIAIDLPEFAGYSIIARRVYFK